MKLSKLERAEKAGHGKIARRAQRGREKLDQHRHPNIDSARQRLDEWERRQHERLGRDMRKAREQLARAEQTVQEKLDQRG